MRKPVDKIYLRKCDIIYFLENIFNEDYIFAGTDISLEVQIFKLKISAMMLGLFFSIYVTLV